MVRVHSSLPIKAIKYDCFYFFIIPTLCCGTTRKAKLCNQGVLLPSEANANRTQTNLTGGYKVGVGGPKSTHLYQRGMLRALLFLFSPNYERSEFKEFQLIIQTLISTRFESKSFWV